MTATNKVNILLRSEHVRFHNSSKSMCEAVYLQRAQESAVEIQGQQGINNLNRVLLKNETGIQFISLRGHSLHLHCQLSGFSGQLEDLVIRSIYAVAINVADLALRAPDSKSCAWPMCIVLKCTCIVHLHRSSYYADVDHNVLNQSSHSCNGGTAAKSAKQQFNVNDNRMLQRDPPTQKPCLYRPAAEKTLRSAHTTLMHKKPSLLELWWRVKTWRFNDRQKLYHK